MALRTSSEPIARGFPNMAVRFHGDACEGLDDQPDPLPQSGLVDRLARQVSSDYSPVPMLKIASRFPGVATATERMQLLEEERNGGRRVSFTLSKKEGTPASFRAQDRANVAKI